LSLQPNFSTSEQRRKATLKHPRRARRVLFAVFWRETVTTTNEIRRVPSANTTRSRGPKLTRIYISTVKSTTHTDPHTCITIV
jgi:hypothetical protein